MTHLYLIRHGAFVSNIQERVFDGGLSERGRDQAERLRDRRACNREIEGDVLIASTLPRAMQTAEIISPALGLTATFDCDIEEWRNVGDHDLTDEEFGARLKAAPYDQRAFYYPTLDGEHWARFMFRAGLGLNRITQQHTGKKIVIVCHGGIIEAAFLFFVGLSTLQPPPIVLDPAYTSITHWQKIKGTTRDVWLLERYNDATHLV